MNLRLIIAYIGNLVDIGATLYLTQRGWGYEINPLSRWLLGDPCLFVLVKIAAMTLAVLACQHGREKKIVRALSWVLAAEYGAVALYYAWLFAFVV